MKFWKGFTIEEIEEIKKHAPKFIKAIKTFEKNKKFALSILYQEEIGEAARAINISRTAKGLVGNIEIISYNYGLKIYEALVDKYVFGVVNDDEQVN